MGLWCDVGVSTNFEIEVSKHCLNTTSPRKMLIFVMLIIKNFIVLIIYYKEGVFLVNKSYSRGKEYVRG